MARKKTKKKKVENVYEEFYFSIESWAFDHHQWVQVETSRDGTSAELHDFRGIEFRGSLVSRTRRPVKRAELTIRPDGAAPRDWPEDRDCLGVVIGIRDGMMTAFHDVTEPAFQNLLALTLAGRVVEFSVRAKNLRYGRGKLDTAQVRTERTDPDDMA